MRFCPKNTLIAFTSDISAVAALCSTTCRFILYAVSDIITCRVVCYRHFTSVISLSLCIINTVKNFTIEINAIIVIYLLIVISCTVKNYIPEITCKSWVISRSFYMLSCVKTETVSTAVYTLFQKIKYHLLNLAVTCIKVRHTHISLSNIETTIA